MGREISGASACAETIWLAPQSKQRTSDSSESWYPSPVEKVDGEILELDAKQLRVAITVRQTESRSIENRFDAHRLLWVQRAQASAGEQAVVAAYLDGRYGETLQGLSAVLKDRPPVWRQQFLTMMGASAAMKTRRGKIALELVSQLDARPLPPLVLAWLPIDWVGTRPPATLVDAANARLDDASPATRLVAASWLLSTRDRAEAESVLRSLATQSDRPDVASLAACLLWRLATPPEVKRNAEAWLGQLDQLPMVWQTGPMVTLANKFRAAGLADQAERLKQSLELTPIHPHPAVR